MGKVKVQAGQSLPDIVVQELGDLTQLFAVAFANGLSVTDDLPVGGFVEVFAQGGSRVADVFAGMTHKPATALTESDNELDSYIRIFDDTFDPTFE